MVQSKSREIGKFRLLWEPPRATGSHPESGPAIDRSMREGTSQQASNLILISIIISKSSDMWKLLFLRFCSGALQRAFQRIIKLDWRVIFWTWLGEGYKNLNQRFQRLWLYHLISITICCRIYVLDLLHIWHNQQKKHFVLGVKASKNRQKETSIDTLSVSCLFLLRTFGGKKWLLIHLIRVMMGSDLNG